MPEALNIEPGNPTWDRKWEQHLGVCVGEIGEGDSSRVSLPRYPQASSLPQLTLLVCQFWNYFRKKYFFWLFWRTLRKKIGFIKLRAVLLKVCFQQLQPDKMLDKRSLQSIKSETHTLSLSSFWRFLKHKRMLKVQIGSVLRRLARLHLPSIFQTDLSTVFYLVYFLYHISVSPFLGNRLWEMPMYHQLSWCLFCEAKYSSMHPLSLVWFLRCF